MQEFGKKNPSVSLSGLGINVGITHWNLSPEDLVKTALSLGQGVLNDAGALCVNTGKFTGRSPKDRATGVFSLRAVIIDARTYHTGNQLAAGGLRFFSGGLHGRFAPRRLYCEFPCEE